MNRRHDMGKRLITQEDVRKAAEAGKKTIDAPPEESIVTPMARDEASVLGVVFNEAHPLPARQPGGSTQIETPRTESLVSKVCEIMRERLPPGVGSSQLEDAVRAAVAAKLSAAAPPPRQRSEEGSGGVHGIRFIDGSRLRGGSSSISTAEKALVSEALVGDGRSAFAAGYMRLEKGSFDRIVDRPEIGIVIEGELHLTVGGETFIGKPGDMIYLPAGATAVYGTPSKVLLACVNGAA
jgi:ethanolamine utilization protein EutQ